MNYRPGATFGMVWLPATIALGLHVAHEAADDAVLPDVVVPAVVRASFLAPIQVASGIMHVTASILARRQVPGVWSAPLLLVTGLGLAAMELAR